MENISVGRKWLELKNGSNFLSDKDYCATRDIFQARLDKLRIALENKKYFSLDKIYPLIAVIGEIGNNSFDHNLGKWRDIPGIYFNSDFKNKIIVLTDRGQGILSSLRAISRLIKTDAEAIKIAFTKKISGRFPEKRGNGLKFVVKVAKELNLDILFQSGNASIKIDSRSELDPKQENTKILGVLAQIKF